MIFLCSFSSKKPTRPYSCFEPTLNRLIPFSDDQLFSIRENNVLRAIEYYDDSTFVEHVFNTKGNLVLSEEHNSWNGKDTIVSRGDFTYDENSRLTRKKEWFSNLGQSFDSIVYDKEGRIVHYSAYYDNYYDNTLEREAYFNLSLIEHTNGKSVLLNQSYLDSGTIYILDNNNQMLLSYNTYRRDSVFKRANQKEYWFKDEQTHGYRKGRRIDYENARIASDSLFEMYYRNSTIHHINQYKYAGDKLMRVNGRWHNENKTFFTYYDSGLLFEKIEVTENHIMRSYFKYYY